MPSSGVRETYTSFFVCRESDIENLSNSIIKAGLKDLKFEVKHADNIKTTYYSVPEVTKLTNDANRRITRIVISSSYYNQDEKIVRAADIDINSESEFSPIGFSASNIEENDLIVLQRGIHNSLSNMQNKFSFLRKYGSFAIWIISLFVLFYIIMEILTGMKSLDDMPTALKFFSSVLMSIPLSLISAFVSEKIIKSLFPIGIFAIGNGKKRLEDLESKRVNYLYGSAVTIVLGIALGIVNKYVI